MSYEKAFEEATNRLKSSVGLMFVDTGEETRFIREISKRFKNSSVQFWSISQGLHEIKNNISNEFNAYHYIPSSSRTSKDGSIRSRASIQGVLSIIEEDCRYKASKGDDNKTIYVLRDLMSVLKNPVDIRKLKDIIYLLSTNLSSIVVTGQGIKIPPELEKDSVYTCLDYPSKEEIKNVILKKVRDKVTELNENLSKDEKIDLKFSDEDVAKACAGLTEDQIINTIEYAFSIHGKIDIDLIFEEKKSIINKSDLLEYWDCDDSINDVGGFGEFKEWVKINKAIIDNPEKAEKFMADPPKAILLLGTQGTGKTAVCKALAKSLKMGLIKFQVDKVFAGLVGQSESNMRRALSQIEAAGGVVVIDEIDKALSGAGGSDKTDGGTTKRVIGSFLDWLQKDHPGVFLAVTANDITDIRNNHPELLRKGRFDEIWFSDVPNFEERKEIFKIHLRKKARKISNFNLDKLANIKYSDGRAEYDLSGAEIESSVKDAIREKLAKNIDKSLTINGKYDITTKDIIESAKKIKPITKIAKETINKMRKWSQDNARNVSNKNIETHTKENSSNKNKNLQIRSKNIKL